MRKEFFLRRSSVLQPVEAELRFRESFLVTSFAVKRSNIWLLAQPVRKGEERIKKKDFGHSYTINRTSLFIWIGSSSTLLVSTISLMYVVNQCREYSCADLHTPDDGSVVLEGSCVGRVAGPGAGFLVEPGMTCFGV